MSASPSRAIWSRTAGVRAVSGIAVTVPLSGGAWAAWSSRGDLARPIAGVRALEREAAEALGAPRADPALDGRPDIDTRPDERVAREDGLEEPLALEERGVEQPLPVEPEEVDGDQVDRLARIDLLLGQLLVEILGKLHAAWAPATADEAAHQHVPGLGQIGQAGVDAGLVVAGDLLGHVGIEDDAGRVGRHGRGERLGELRVPFDLCAVVEEQPLAVLGGRDDAQPGPERLDHGLRDPIGGGATEPLEAEVARELEGVIGGHQRPS